LQALNPNILDYLLNYRTCVTKQVKKSPAKQSELNPTYVKIGKRIRQAHLSAKVTNSREFSLGLGWSAGRVNNFELGISTPGPDETEIFAEASGGLIQLLEVVPNGPGLRFLHKPIGIGG
jgi:hypothetical protein